MEIENNSEIYKHILQKVVSKKFTVGIIGLGYVGLPLALGFCERGIRTFGFDININIINSLRRCESYIQHICSSELEKYIKNKKLNPDTNIENIKKVDVIIICVPTPLNKNKEPDLTFIKNSLLSIRNSLKKGQVLILESTTYPGTTEEIIKPFIEANGLEIGKDFFLIYSPEREDPGNRFYNASNTPKLLGGCSRECAIIGEKIYNFITGKVVVLSSPKAAEMTKLLENIHRAVNIGLVNELKPIAESLGVDIYEIVRAAATKPFGFMPYYPGPGLGGHCIPIDPFYLTWKAREFGLNTKFIELAGEINASMPSYVVNKVSNLLNDTCKSVKKSKILVLGISYKKNIDDARESPSLEIINLLLKKGAHIEYSDPYFKEFPKLRKYNFSIKKVKLDKKNIKKFDCTLLLTDHDSFDYELIKENSKLIVDTRGKYMPSDNIVRA